MLKIDYVLRSRGITQTELARRTGINPSIVSQLVRGERPAFPKWRDAILRELDWPSERASELFEECEVV